MYRKDNDGWLKHIDFIILDLICLQGAYVLAFAISGYSCSSYDEYLKRVLKRGHYIEFMITLKHCLIVGGVSILYLFLLQEGQNYSRLALILLVVIYTGLTYLVRELRKRQLQKKMVDGSEKALLIVASSDIAEQVVRNMKANNYARYTIAGVAIIDRDWVGSVVGGVEVVADVDSAAMYVCREWVDEVLIVTSGSIPYPKELIEQFTETGVTVHLNLTKVSNVPGKKQFVEKIGNYTVLTTSMNYASGKQLFVKRIIDILAGLAGCILTGIIFIFVAPVIYKASPGPIFFSQERVGKNGKKFKMYKFRSMYMDAEARKAELMKDNKLGDGKMFKLDFDPRVIGNKILPDGTKKTGIGDFIRRTSLDEFPQFFNVLKGDMSLVGLRDIIGTTKKNLCFSMV